MESTQPSNLQSAEQAIEKQKKILEVLGEFPIQFSYLTKDGDELVWKPKTLTEIITAPSLTMVLWSVHQLNVQTKEIDPRKRSSLYDVKEELLRHVIQKWSEHFPAMKYGYGRDLGKIGTGNATTCFFDCPGIGQMSFHTSCTTNPYPYEYTGISNSRLDFHMPYEFMFADDEARSALIREEQSLVYPEENSRRRTNFREDIADAHNTLVQYGIDPFMLYEQQS
jgi:hypothetical protein